MTLPSTEITVVSPRTGEQLTLDAPTADLAGFVADSREYKHFLDEGINFVSGELLARLDKDGRWTKEIGDLKLSAPSPAATVEYDELALHSALMSLADEGVITVEAVDRAVETVVTYKARKAGIAALRKLGGRVQAVIDAHGNEVAPRRYVKVSRA